MSMRPVAADRSGGKRSARECVGGTLMAALKLASRVGINIVDGLKGLWHSIRNRDGARNQAMLITVTTKTTKAGKTVVKTTVNAGLSCLGRS